MIGLCMFLFIFISKVASNTLAYDPMKAQTHQCCWCLVLTVVTFLLDCITFAILQTTGIIVRANKRAQVNLLIDKLMGFA